MKVILRKKSSSLLKPLKWRRGRNENRAAMTGSKNDLVIKVFRRENNQLREDQKITRRENAVYIKPQGYATNDLCSSACGTRTAIRLVHDRVHHNTVNAPRTYLKIPLHSPQRYKGGDPIAWVEMTPIKLHMKRKRHEISL